MKSDQFRRLIDPANPYHRWVDPRYRDLRLPDVMAYLLYRDWKQLSTDRAHFLVFAEPSGELLDGRPFCQFVPDSEEYDDYPARMFELLTGLAEVEGRQASAVIDDILQMAGRRASNGPAAGRPHETETTGT